MNPTHFAVRVTRRPLAWGSTLLLIVATSAAAAPFAREARLTGHGDPLGTWGARFGGAVAMDGDTLAVGAPAENLAAGDEAGVVYVYLRTGDQWALQQRLLAADGHGGVTFGASLALDGDTLLVGAPHADATGGLDAGAAYVFVRSAGVFAQRQKLAAAAGTSGDRFAAALALEGDTAVVGAPREDTALGMLAGAAYVFTRVAGTFTQQQRLVAAGAADGDQFGSSLALAGQTLLVGAPYGDTAGGASAGAAYVFGRSNGLWSQQALLLPSDGAAADHFGASVALIGNDALVGAPDDDLAAGSDAGSAHVFVRSGATWLPQQKLVAPAPGGGDHFGAALALDVDRLLVGAPGDDTAAGSEAGSAWIFARGGSSWAVQAALSASNAAPEAAFGGAVTLRGASAVAGAAGAPTVGGQSAGLTYVWQHDGGTWSEQRVLVAPDQQGLDNFGISVALSGDTALVGAQWDNVAGGFGAGSASVFVRSGSTWTEQQKLVAPDASAGDAFGSSVALSADTALVGAFGADGPSGTSSGAVYVFTRSGSAWSFQQKLTPPAMTAAFGGALAVSGATAIVGAQGAAYAFVRSGGLWTLQQKLLASDTAPADGYGESVALAGDMAVVGAYLHDTPAGAEAGTAYVFVRSGGVWSQHQRLSASDGSANDRFGRSVAVSAGTVLVGAQTDARPSNPGAAYVFGLSPGGFVEQQKLVPPGGTLHTGFGRAVTLVGDTALVGAPFSAPGGAVHVFARADGLFAFQQSLLSSDGAPFDYFGSALALSGDTLIGGARGDDNPDGSEAGSATLYRLSSKGDFDRNGQTDLLVRSNDDGHTDAWLMEGATRPGPPQAISPEPESLDWIIACSDDFDGDHRSDLLFWNRGTGAAEFWLMDGTARLGPPVPLAGALAPPWRPVASADFDHDGRADLVWRNDATLKLAIWKLVGTTVAGTLIPSPDQAAHANWELIGAQDWNGDGNSDFLWYNADSGKIVLWFLDAQAVRLLGQFTNPPQAGANNWKVMASGDFGVGPGGVPGTFDLVWRNATSGRFVIWYMDRAGQRTGATFTSPDAPSPNPTHWTIVGPR